MQIAAAQDMGSLVVATVNGAAVTRDQLVRAFDAVQDPTNWKLPINRVMDRESVEKFGGVAVIAEAVVFFAGCRPEIDEIGTGTYRIRAVGYYAAVGA